MVTKISEFEHKVANYSVCMTEKSNILHRPEIFMVDEFNFISRCQLSYVSQTTRVATLTTIWTFCWKISVFWHKIGNKTAEIMLKNFLVSYQTSHCKNIRCVYATEQRDVLWIREDFERFRTAIPKCRYSEDSLVAYGVVQ